MHFGMRYGFGFGEHVLGSLCAAAAAAGVALPLFGAGWTPYCGAVVTGVGPTSLLTLLLSR